MLATEQVLAYLWGKVNRLGKYTTILFDLDGTLTDPHVGITKSVQYALDKLGICEPDLKKLIHFIGPPLAGNFRDCYGMTEVQAQQAVQFYREYFSQTGIFENAVYPGITELLETLKQRGLILAVATSKPAVFANRILQYFNLTGYFDYVAGSNLDGTLVEKTEVIANALQNLPPVTLKQVLMVGDRKHDILGAQENRIDSLAVGYGYGSAEELLAAQPSYFVRTIDEILLYC